MVLGPESHVTPDRDFQTTVDLFGQRSCNFSAESDSNPLTSGRSTLIHISCLSGFRSFI